MRIIFATGNKDKMREIREIMADLDVEVLSMKEAEISVDIDENGETFEDNALIKVRAIGVKEDAIILADDSGIEIDALNKEPGVHSARFLGTDTPYTIKNKKILEMIEDKKGKERSARYVCVIAALFPDGSEKTIRGVMEGEIALSPSGENGFGYDPIFYLPEIGKTTAEISEEEKNEISHRGLALKEMKEVIGGYLK